MDFSKMRHRIVFLRPSKTELNSMKENVPVWVPFKPSMNNNLQITEEYEVYLTSDYAGNAVLKHISGEPYAHKLLIKEYAVWAYVAPKTGREYDEAQKLRAETTYNITTRYFPGITADMKIMYGSKIFRIESVLNIDERNEQLRIVASEVDTYGKER